MKWVVVISKHERDKGSCLTAVIFSCRGSKGCSMGGAELGPQGEWESTCNKSESFGWYISDVRRCKFGQVIAGNQPVITG